MSAYVRTVKTASSARAVQIVHASRRGSHDIEHIGSAHHDAELELLKAVARSRFADGRGELDLGLREARRGGDSTLYFETDTGDGFGEPGFSKERQHATIRRATINATVRATTPASLPPRISAGQGHHPQVAPTRCARPASRQIDSGAEDPAFDAVSRFAAAAQTARTSASRLTAYSSSQQTAASHAADACAAMSCAPSSRPAALSGSTRSRSGTSTCDSSQSISAI